MNKKDFFKGLHRLEVFVLNICKVNHKKTGILFYYNLIDMYHKMYEELKTKEILIKTFETHNRALYYSSTPFIISLLLLKRSCLLYKIECKNLAYYDAVMACKILPNFQEIKDKLCIDFIKPDLLKKEKVYYYKPIGKSIHKQEAFTLSNIKNKKPCLF